MDLASRIFGVYFEVLGAVLSALSFSQAFDLFDRRTRIASAVKIDFQLRDRVNERIWAVLDVTSEFDVRKARKDLLIGHAQLHLRDA